MGSLVSSEIVEQYCTPEQLQVGKVYECGSKSSGISVVMRSTERFFVYPETISMEGRVCTCVAIKTYGELISMDGFCIEGREEDLAVIVQFEDGTCAVLTGGIGPYRKVQ